MFRLRKCLYLNCLHSKFPGLTCPAEELIEGIFVAGAQRASRSKKLFAAEHTVYVNLQTISLSLLEKSQRRQRRMRSEVSQDVPNCSFYWGTTCPGILAKAFSRNWGGIFARNCQHLHICAYFCTSVFLLR